MSFNGSYVLRRHLVGGDHSSVGSEFGTETVSTRPSGTRLVTQGALEGKVGDFLPLLFAWL